MGEVFLGVDERLDRKVAVKTLLPRIRIPEDKEERFRREARILSRLDHPSICRLYDMVYLDQEPFLLLEYLEGHTLGELAGTLTEPEVLEAAVQIARALAAAHREGIIHRDLKPDNVMLTDDGRVKILDFGIGRFMEEIHPEEESPCGKPGSRRSTGRTPTIPGSIIGTPRYMSPEQARGDALTPSTDLYSLGIMLWELLEGGSPYRSSGAGAHLADPPAFEKLGRSPGGHVVAEFPRAREGFCGNREDRTLCPLRRHPGGVDGSTGLCSPDRYRGRRDECTGPGSAGRRETGLRLGP